MKKAAAIIWILAYPFYYILGIFIEGNVEECCKSNFSDVAWFVVMCLGVVFSFLPERKIKICLMACVIYSSYLILFILDYLTGVIIKLDESLIRIVENNTEFEKIISLYPVLLILITSVLCMIYMFFAWLISVRSKR